MLKTKPLVAVDSDTLIFSAAAANEERSIEVLHQPSGKSRVFKNRTEFKAAMQEKNKEITSDYLITDKQEPMDVSFALHTIKQAAERILDTYSDCEVVFCAGAEWNFRDSLDYPTKYKGNRTNMLRPLLLSECQEYFARKFKAIKATGHEADDEVSILAYDALRQGREAYILSPDGDSRQFDGIKLGKYGTLPKDCVCIQWMHPVKWEDGKLDTYGLPWLIGQHVTGDPTDGLKPTYLTNFKYADKGYYNDVKTFTEPLQFFEFATTKYKLWYPEPVTYTTWYGKKVTRTWEDMLDLYWKGTTMKRERDKVPNFWSFMKEKGYA